MIETILVSVKFFVERKNDSASGFSKIDQKPQKIDIFEKALVMGRESFAMWLAPLFPC